MIDCAHTGAYFIERETKNRNQNKGNEQKEESAMKTKMFVGLVLALAVIGYMPMIASAQAVEELVVLDFDTGDKPNNLGGDFGAWDKDPNDDTQWCEVSFEYGDDALGEPDGYSLRLSYDVDSPSPAYNGFWTKLEGEDFSDYNTLNLYVKGDSEK